MPKPKNTKNSLSELLHDRTVILTAMICLTLIIMTSLILGVNLNANLFGAQFSLQNLQDDAARIQKTADKLITAKKEPELLELIKHNQLKTAAGSPSPLEHLSAEEFKNLVDREGLRVVPKETGSGQAAIAVQVGNDIEVLTDNQWNPPDNMLNLTNSGEGGNENTAAATR